MKAQLNLVAANDVGELVAVIWKLKETPAVAEAVDGLVTTGAAAWALWARAKSAPRRDRKRMELAKAFAKNRWVSEINGNMVWVDGWVR